MMPLLSSRHRGGRSPRPLQPRERGKASEVKVKEKKLDSRKREIEVALTLAFRLLLPLSLSLSLFRTKTTKSQKMGGAAVIINSEEEWTAALEKATAEGKAVSQF